LFWDKAEESGQKDPRRLGRAADIAADEVKGGHERPSLRKQSEGVKKSVVVKPLQSSFVLAIYSGFSEL
jgi:hypothetical protein